MLIVVELDLSYVCSSTSRKKEKNHGDGLHVFPTRVESHFILEVIPCVVQEKKCFPSLERKIGF